MTELCELFLYIALDKWVNRLADEAGKVVPAAVAAVKAADAMFEDPSAPAPSASNESTEVQDIHPAVLLQHLPGGVLAVKSVLLAKHRARQMKLQAKLAKFCCCPQVSQLESASAQPASSLLDQAGSRSATALARFKNSRPLRIFAAQVNLLLRDTQQAADPRVATQLVTSVRDA